jgi:hypothetical protein
MKIVMKMKLALIALLLFSCVAKGSGSEYDEATIAKLIVRLKNAAGDQWWIDYREENKSIFVGSMAQIRGIGCGPSSNPEPEMRSPAIQFVLVPYVEPSQFKDLEFDVDTQARKAARLLDENLLAQRRHLIPMNWNPQTAEEWQFYVSFKHARKALESMPTHYFEKCAVRIETWMLVHPVNEKSPVFVKTMEDVKRMLEVFKPYDPARPLLLPPLKHLLEPYPR